MFKIIHSKLSIVVFCIFCISANSNCKTNTINESDLISEYLIQKVKTGNRNDATTALFLLSHLVLYETDVAKLDTMYQNEQDTIKKILFAYTLFQRTQEEKYKTEFINLYPEGKQQKLIWELSRHETTYATASSPLQKELAYFAMTDENAFKKLLSGYKFADGANGDALYEQIAHVYKYNQDLVLKELKRNNIDPLEFGIK